MAAEASAAAETEEGAAGTADPLLTALLRLIRQLDRPCAEAELRAAAPIPEGGADAACLVRVAERLGFAPRLEPVKRWRLRRLATPYLLLGREPGQVWLVRGRTGKHLVLVAPLQGEAAAFTARTAARMGARTLRLMLPMAGAETRRWRGEMLRRLRPVLAQIALASAVSNLLALATPLFMITVYNQVIRHGAIEMLDALAIGMGTLFAFDLVLRAVRGYLASHAGARLEAALGTETVHHLTRLPYRALEAMPAGQAMERLRQLEQLRQFLTGSLPLLLADLAFVGLFVVALLVLSPPLALVTVAAMPLFVLLSWLAHRRQEGFLKAGFRASAGKAATLGEAVTQALTVKALGLEQEVERRFEARLVESAWAGFRVGSAGQVLGSVAQGLQQVAAIVLVYVGARMIIAGELNVGALVACNILSARALAPMRQLFAAWTQLQQARESFRRLDDLMREPAEVAAPLGSEVTLGGRVRLEGVTFRYADDGATGARGPQPRRGARDGAGRDRRAGVGQEHARQAGPRPRAAER